MLFDVLFPSMGQEMAESDIALYLSQHSSIDDCRVGFETRARLPMMRIITSFQRKRMEKYEAF